MFNETSWHTYPKIYALGHVAVLDIFDGKTILQEKVDGSQFSFGVFNGVLRCKSKGKEQLIDAPDKMFNKAIETIKGIQDKLVDGWTYRGEYLQKPKHNVICYSREPKGNIILFDINDGQESYLPPDKVAAAAEALGLECVPTFLTDLTSSPTLEELDKWLETESILGGHKIEGVVIKNYSQFGRDKKVLMAKFVSEAYKEKHSRHWKISAKTGKNITQIITEVYRNENRWNKAIQHLKEKGELDVSPKDIGPLIKEIQQDVLDECSEEIKNKLFNYFWGDISRGIIRGFPDWYKRELVKNVSETIESEGEDGQ